MNLKPVTALFFVLSLNTYSQNPITPAGVYLADPSAKVMPDGRLYIYGSLDESCSYYCSYRHHVMATTDMREWAVYENRFASKGEGDAVGYNDDLLFAPDCAVANDSFYLYYCQPNADAEGVAVSSNPAGPFLRGQKLDLGGHQQIDPCVFIDDDGQAYYVWGQFTLKMAKLMPNMRELDLTTLKDSIITEKNHFFHEGAYLTKRKGIYYLVFADISRGNMPTCLGYATSTNVFGPYTYRGVIIDNNFCNPGNWNNHGSIAEFGDRWYVFYHRSTHGCNMMRKACVEPIIFRPDGSIPEVEMTSQGAAGPLDAFRTIEAEQACLLHGGMLIEADGQAEVLARIDKGSRAAFKYIHFGPGADSITVRVRTGTSTGGFNLKLDQPWGEHLGYVHIDKRANGPEWREVSFPIKNTSGVHAVWFDFYLLEGASVLDCAVDWFRFH